MRAIPILTLYLLSCDGTLNVKTRDVLFERCESGNSKDCDDGKRASGDPGDFKDPSGINAKKDYIADAQSPTFNSLDLVNEAIDAFINNSETGSANDAFILDASDYVSANYTFFLSNSHPVNCDNSRIYDNKNIPSINSLPAVDGDYIVCVKLENSSGNITYGKSEIITRDTSAPNFTSLAGADEAGDGFISSAEIGSTNTAFILNAVNYSLVAYTDILDNTPAVTCDVSQAYSNGSIPLINTIPAVDDDYILCVRLTDDAGNITYGESEVITRDTQGPTFNVLNGANEADDGYINANESVSSNVAYVLDASGYAQVAYSSFLDDTPSQICDVSQSYTTNSIPAVSAMPASDEDYVICARLSDSAGNIIYGKSSTLTRDTGIPTVTIDDVIINDTNKSAVPLSGSCSEDGRSVAIGGSVSGSATCSSGSWNTSMDYSGETDGTVNVTADLDDAAGNHAVQASRGLTKDTDIPAVSLTVTAINDANKNSVPIEGTCTEEGRSVDIGGAVPALTNCIGGVFSIHLDYSGESDGTVSITADLVDAAGNNAIQAAENFPKDVIPPTVEVGSDVLTRTQVTINPVASGATSFQWTKQSGTGSVDFGTPTNEATTIAADFDDIYLIRLTVQDAAGNSAYDETTFTWDTTAPVAAISGVPEGISLEQVLDVTVSGTGVDKYAYKLLHSGNTDCTGGGYSSWIDVSTKITDDMSSLPPGDMTLCVRGQDQALNSQTEASATFSSWTKSTESYRYFKFVIESLTGSCSSGKVAIDNFGLYFDGNWQTNSFSGATGTIGSYAAVTVTESSFDSDEGWEAFTTSASWRSNSEFETSSPYDVNSPGSSWLKMDFGSGNEVTIKGLKIDGGYGTGQYQFCAPDSFHLEGSSDDSSWAVIDGSSRSQDTTSEIYYLFDSVPGTPYSFTLNPRHQKADLMWVHGGGTETGYMLVRREGSPVTWMPVNATLYSVGQSIDGGVHEIVYRGANLNFLDINLTNGTNYYYAIHSYDGSNVYSGAKTGMVTPVLVLPDPPTDVYAIGGYQQVGLDWTIGSGSEVGVLIVRKGGSAPTWSPTDGVAYSTGSQGNGNDIVFRGSSSSFADTSATVGTTWHYKIYSYQEDDFYSSSVSKNATPHNNSDFITGCTNFGTLYGRSCGTYCAIQGLTCVGIGWNAAASNGTLVLNSSCADAVAWAYGRDCDDTFSSGWHGRCHCRL